MATAVTEVTASVRHDICEAMTSIDRLSTLLSSISLSSTVPAIPRQKIRVVIKPTATSWSWKYEESDDFSQTSTNPDHIITDIRDWFDLTATDLACFDILQMRLKKAQQGTKIRLQIKRDGRQVEFYNSSKDELPDVVINCN